MAEVDLVHPELTQCILAVPLITKCRQFIANPSLILAPSHITSATSFDAFQAFVETLEGHAAYVTDGNYTGLSRLCQEFGFEGLNAQRSAFHPSAGFAEALRCISEVEKRVKVDEGQIAELQSELSSQRKSHKQALRRFEAKVAKLKDVIHALPARVGRAEADIARAATEVAQVGQLRADVAALKRWTKPPPVAPPGWLDSLIASEFPPLFEEFRAKRFYLLWRGSRDGFTAWQFHRHCDCRANTLTLKADTDGNIFGGFTPVEWESGNKVKGDDSLRSFLFMLRNPHGVPPRKFALRAEGKQYAIYCLSRDCAVFGSEIAVRENCNANRDSSTRIGNRWGITTYVNETAFRDFFTGAEKFTVKEIEIFEIAD
jgi:hypothetical protein